MAILFINLRILIAKFDNAKTNIFRRGFWTNKVYIRKVYSRIDQSYNNNITKIV